MTQNTATENTATENTATENMATENMATGNTATKQPPAPNVWPAFRANDARGLIKFLVEALGFEEVVVYGEADRVDHAELAWPPGGGVMLGSARDEAEQSGVTGPGHFSAYVVTSDPDGLYARAVAHGAKVASELHDTDYGSRDFAIEDPEGNHWSFGTYPGHPR
jgi:uncharacterized glyoxalase superfamily protein PhnB